MTAHVRILRSGLLFHVLIVALFLACSLAAFCQTETATLTGTITDPSGANVAGASVQITNVETGAVIQTSSNGSGLYVVPNLRPGHYRVIVEKAGFKQMALTDLTLNVQDIVSRNFQMQVGTVSESITVSGEGININTSDASVSTVIDQSYVQNMPLNGRSFQDLILLTPGVVTNSPQSAHENGSSGEFSVNGQRTESNNYTVDGVSANIGAAANIFSYAMTEGAGASGAVPGATALGTTQALVPVDDLQEFRVQSSTYSAQYGRNPGGQFAFETKSGTNQWHGTASDYLRNDYFDATDYFTDYLRSVNPSLKKSAIRQNDFGGTFGGPVKIPGVYNGKDKTFFFVSYEGLRLLLPQPAAFFPVPDACMRGDAASCPSGRMPAASAVLPVVDAFSAPNTTANEDLTDGVAQFVGAWSNPASVNSTNVRLDQVISQRAKLFFRFSNTTSDSTTRGLAADFLPPSMLSSSPYTTRTYTAGADNLFSSRISNDFRLNYSSNVTSNTLALDSFGGAKPVNLNQLAQLSGPNASVSSAFFLGPYVLNIGQQVTNGAQQQWNLVDTLNLVQGRHQLSLGVDYRRLTPYAKPFNPSLGYFFGFVAGENDVETNTAAISFLADAPAYPLYTNYSLFAQDDWKATQRLNLSFGLRWEINPPPGVTRGTMPRTVLFQGPDPNLWTLAPEGTPLWKTTWFNLAPRFGAAYTLRNAPGKETIIRGGGGLFFDSGQQTGSFGFDGPGFSIGSFGFGSFPGMVSGTPLTDQSAAAYGYYPHLQLPYTVQWNFSVEQALGKSQALTASYVGSHAGRLLQTNRFQSTLGINGVFAIQNGSTSDYDSAQLQFRRRLTRGFTALGSYTWSHCLDYGSSNATFGYQRGNCDFDVRHNFSGAFSYDLPDVGHGRLASAFLDHWGLDGRLTARTAFPVTLGGNPIPLPNGKYYSAGLSFASGQPVYIYGSNCANTYNNVVNGVLLPCPGGRAINPNAFTSVSSGYGDTPRNFARGFGAWQMDTAVRREFPIHERLKLQFRAEAFNLFNHPNLGTINGQFGQANFGQATATLANSLGVLNSLYQMGGPRSMQFALKLVF
jgi:hypothetical protein